MNFRKTLSSVHLAGTVWFIMCTGFVFIMAMRQAGFNLLVIFSLSGYLALLVTLLVSLYLYTIYRGVDKGPDMQQEHPLTSTTYYMAFYVSTPFWGAIAGVFGVIGEKGITSLAGGIALGTIGATFLTWVVVDCIADSVELLMPQPRKHRANRFAEAKLKRQQEQENREQLLALVLEQEQDNKQLWERVLSPQAARLANLLAGDGVNFARAEQEAVVIGVEAWRMGGLSCMRQLRNMTADAFKQQYNQRQFVDYVSAWWDGIGNWRTPAAG